MGPERAVLVGAWRSLGRLLTLDLLVAFLVVLTSASDMERLWQFVPIGYFLKPVVQSVGGLCAKLFVHCHDVDVNRHDPPPHGSNESKYVSAREPRETR